MWPTFKAIKWAAPLIGRLPPLCPRREPRQPAMRPLPCIEEDVHIKTEPDDNTEAVQNLGHHPQTTEMTPPDEKNPFKKRLRPRKAKMSTT
jgi:hypothetical protein